MWITAVLSALNPTTGFPLDGFLPTVQWTVSRAVCEPPPASNPKLQIADTFSKSVPCHMSENGDSRSSRRLLTSASS